VRISGISTHISSKADYVCSFSLEASTGWLEPGVFSLSLETRARYIQAVWLMLWRIFADWFPGYQGQ
jgi:hypothetical protein